ncbi:MAG: FAD:protein FMN transferase [Paenirhodobacter sp.]|uniref:FAD:protein FMN transferase n=1 Tax=Paenirhodobacter sp. TaxID=1965326 RepID=UPI003D0A98D7
MLNRRRFLALSACATALPARAAPPVARWHGAAMGSAATLTLSGLDDHAARPIFARVEAELARIEAQFSLHRDSALTRLNRDGRLAYPDRQILDLFALAGRVHAATAGAFDPTVQPLWRAIAEGHDPGAARALIGWAGVEVTPAEIRLARPGMALTFNGIAQGHAADRIADLLRAEGMRDVLVDMGEIAAMGQRPGGGPWRSQIVGPDGLPAGRLDLRDRALATSAPAGTRIGPGGDAPHILDPLGPRTPRWRLAAVAAPRAALADALSTAACVMDRVAIEAALTAFPGATLVALA